MAYYTSDHVEIIIKIGGQSFVVPQSQLLSISVNSMLEFETVDMTFYAPDGFWSSMTPIVQAQIEGAHKMIEGQVTT